MRACWRPPIRLVAADMSALAFDRDQLLESGDRFVDFFFCILASPAANSCGGTQSTCDYLERAWFS